MANPTRAGLADGMLGVAAILARSQTVPSATARELEPLRGHLLPIEGQPERDPDEGDLDFSP